VILHKPSYSEFVSVRGARCHVRRWGDPDAPMLMMLHGWMDMSATFQFVVDAFEQRWNIVAPDWRGYGQSSRRGDTYGLPDYVADLDALIDHYSPDAPVRLLGHSMGGNIGGLYSGIRAHRVAKFVNLEGLGLLLPATKPGAQRLRGWVDDVRAPVAERIFANPGELAARLMRANPRLTPARADFLAAHFCVEQADGQVRLAADPYARFFMPMRFDRDDIVDCWRNTTAEVLLCVAKESHIMQAFETHLDDLHRYMDCWPRGEHQFIGDAGHNMHHDQPGVIAALTEEFLSR
jgi:pimeloyl-ACP methyl ester carboxylesterase